MSKWEWEREKERERERKREREGTDRHTDRDIETETESGGRNIRGSGGEYFFLDIYEWNRKPMSNFATG